MFGCFSAYPIIYFYHSTGDWMKRVGVIIKDYIKNSRAILNSYNNPLKNKENLLKKDKLEQTFYDKEAEKHLINFDETLFKYDPDEKFPLTHQYFYSLLEKIDDKEILDICCGYGFTSVKLAKRNAKVTGIDISPKMIELCLKNASFNNVNEKTDFFKMSAQNMKFENDKFDFVVGFGALHHLNLNLAGKEISRVLRPGGRAIFIEPRIPLKLFIFIRSLLPQKCFESPGGSQLTDREISFLGKFFKSSRITYFIFLKKLARFPIINKYTSQLEKLDWYLVNRFPFLSKLYWAFVLDFET